MRLCCFRGGFDDLRKGGGWHALISRFNASDFAAAPPAARGLILWRDGRLSRGVCKKTRGSKKCIFSIYIISTTDKGRGSCAVAPAARLFWGGDFGQSKRAKISAKSERKQVGGAPGQLAHLSLNFAGVEEEGSTFTFALATAFWAHPACPETCGGARMTQGGQAGGTT